MLAGHTFEHEISTAGALESSDLWTSIAAMRCWAGTRPVPERTLAMTMSMYHVIKAGGLKQGGCNFDAKVRRQSFTPRTWSMPTWAAPTCALAHS